jgi:hypothetical protein
MRMPVSFAIEERGIPTLLSYSHQRWFVVSTTARLRSGLAR